MEDSSPTDVFNLFFDNGIIAEIQSETNRYVKQQINIRKQEGPLKPKSVYAQWKEVSIHEIKIFLANSYSCVFGKETVPARLLDHDTNFTHKLHNKSWDVSRPIPGNPYNVARK
jgi:hypothetical protein